MTNRIMLVIGDCDHQAFSSIEFSVMEKLGSADATGVTFKSTDDLRTADDISLHVNRFLAGVNAKANLDTHNVNVVIVFDKGIDRIDNLKRIQADLEALKPTTGIWQYTFHLVWMIEEYPLRFTYSELLDKLLEGGQAFSHIYIISDRNSEQGYGRDVRTRGASMLISTLQNSTTISSGLYTVGVGKMLITAYEMREYAKHQAVDALMKQSLRWDGFARIEDICACAFDDQITGEADFPEWIEKVLGDQVTTSFAYARGETSTCTRVGKQTTFEFKEIFDTWFERMSAYIERVPFTERIITFFKEDGDFQDYCTQLETSFCARTVREIKAGFIAGSAKKDVIQNYNEFIHEEQVEKQRGLSELMQQWKPYVHRVQDLAKQQLEKRNRILQSYIRDDQFVQLCESVASDTTKSVKADLVQTTITEDRYDAFSTDDFFSEKKAEAMLNWIAEEVCTKANMNDMIASLADNEIGTVIARVYNPTISEARGVFLACPANSKLTGDNAQVYLFMPGKLYNDNLQQWLRCQIIPVSASGYQNVEALALLRIGQDTGIREGANLLTAFRGVATVRPDAEPMMEDRKPPKEILYSKTGSTAERTREEPVDINNKLDIQVTQSPAGFKVTMIWPDGVGQATMRVDSETGQGGSVTLKKEDFLTKGSVSIDHLIGYGLHTITLISGGRTLSKTSFAGRRHQIEMEAEEEDFALDKEILLKKVTLKIIGCDGMEGTQLNSSVCEGMQLRMDHKDYLNLPQPWVKHKQQGWTIIMEDLVYEPVLNEQYASEYQLHIV